MQAVSTHLYGFLFNLLVVYNDGTTLGPYSWVEGCPLDFLTYIFSICLYVYLLQKPYWLVRS